MTKVVRSFLLLTLPNIFVYILLIVFLFSQYKSKDFSLESDNVHYFITSFISSLFLSLYLFIKQNAHKKGIRYKAEVFGLMFYLSLFYILINIIRGNIYLQNIGYAIFFLTLLTRLIQRLLFGGFPLFSFIFNFFLIFLALNNIYIVWIPFAYVAIQILESVLEAKYKFFESLITTKYIYYLTQFSLYAFYLIWILSK